MTMVEGFGWVLLHFVWQGAVVSLALLFALVLVPSSRATMRYALSSAALVLMLLAPVGTAVRLATSQATPSEPGGTAKGRFVENVDEARTVGASSSPARQQQAQSRPMTASAPPVDLAIPATTRDAVERALPWLVAAWAAGVLLLSARLAGGWWRTRRLRTDGVAGAPETCRRVAIELAARMGITRGFVVLASARVAVPVVFGHLKPVVLLPVAALSGLSAGQVEAILAHELAHVRRHDYLVNLAQSVIETLLFYHPAVWWVSRQVRLAREHCCDDLAVAACGDRRGYVEALLGLEQLRQPALLALGAADGPLLARARRVLLDPRTHTEAPSARLAASASALVIAGLAVVGASSAFDAATPPDPTLPVVENGSVVQTQAEVGPPVTVLATPEPDSPLAARWTWAEREARRRGYTRFWIGYAIRPASSIPSIVYLDRGAQIVGDQMSFSGHFMSRATKEDAEGVGRPVRRGSGFTFPGRPLDVASEGPDIKLLFAFATSGEAARLTRVHGSTRALPVDLGGTPVIWLGSADTASSLARMSGLYATTSVVELRQNLVAAGGVHDDSAAVVAWLDRHVTGDGPDEVRAEAAEWLAWHPIRAALVALDRTARTDRASRVRREAAEAMGDLAMPEAADALIALAKSLTDLEARREAVEALGSRSELTARDALAAIARDDASADIQREAVETLGDYDDQRGVAALIEIVRSHPNRDVRREAVETLGDALPAESVLPLLERIAREEADASVATEAVETMADLDGDAAFATLMELARTHPRSEVRREAVESLARHGDERDAAVDQETARLRRAKVIDFLGQLATGDPDDSIRREAVETLGDIPDAEARKRLRAMVQGQADADVRREAIETLVEGAEPSEALALLREIVEKDADKDVRRDAIERLADVRDAGARAALEQIARTHADADMRAEAIESLGNIVPATEIADVLKGIADRDADARVRDEALETLAELPEGAGVAALIDLARAHADPAMRRRALEALIESDHPGARELFERALQKAPAR